MGRDGNEYVCVHCWQKRNSMRCRRRRSGESRRQAISMRYNRGDLPGDSTMPYCECVRGLSSIIGKEQPWGGMEMNTRRRSGESRRQAISMRYNRGDLPGDSTMPYCISKICLEYEWSYAKIGENGCPIFIRKYSFYIINYIYTGKLSRLMQMYHFFLRKLSRLSI
ncbi:hypothetical protein IEQ34_012433 [Dendrobium chrysotoxum]|uniref:Uncharacterized protein n=1 Tax=Dendrobium chrysotoxum TaxID=161865 RepID=A0AAV7GVP6_DENCH|nr:hypothetical protein IEQ34_012433 [Dendrobium chrysotoxum]